MKVARVWAVLHCLSTKTLVVFTNTCWDFRNRINFRSLSWPVCSDFRMLSLQVSPCLLCKHRGGQAGRKVVRAEIDRARFPSQIAEGVFIHITSTPPRCFDENTSGWDACVQETHGEGGGSKPHGFPAGISFFWPWVYSQEGIICGGYKLDGPLKIILR